MLKQVFVLCDSVLTWIERLQRVPRAQVAFSGIGAIAMAAIAYSRGLDPQVIILLTLVTLALILVILHLLIALTPILRERLGPTIYVEIQGFGREKSKSFAVGPFGQRELWKLKIHITVVNRSRSHRVSLKFPEMISSTTVRHGGIDVSGIRTNLGPEEDTTGTIIVDGEDGASGIELLVIDRLTERRARVPVPGRYPDTQKK